MFPNVCETDFLHFFSQLKVAVDGCKTIVMSEVDVMSLRAPTAMPAAEKINTDRQTLEHPPHEKRARNRTCALRKQGVKILKNKNLKNASENPSETVLFKFG